MGEIMSIFKVNSSMKRSKKIMKENNVMGFLILLFFPIIAIASMLLALSFLGIIYSFYIHLKSPYGISIFIVCIGIICGFQIGMEKY
jgi:hypothetical protein